MTFDLAHAEKTVNHWVSEAGRIATEHGFDEQPPAESICLMHSELSEALEDLRNGRRPNEVYFEQPVDVSSTKTSSTTIGTPARPSRTGRQGSSP